MTETYPPPPPPGSYAPPKKRPDIVTKYAVVTLVLGIICFIVAIWGFSAYASRSPYYSYSISTEVGYLISALVLAGGALTIICGIGMFSGQKWALKWSGYTLMGWTKRQDVIEFFGLFPDYSTAPPPPPSANQPVSPPVPPPPAATPPSTRVCPTCGQNLTFIAQYQRWYCQNCRKYI